MREVERWKRYSGERGLRSSLSTLHSTTAVLTRLSIHNQHHNSIVRLHEAIRFDHLRESFNPSRIRPRLELTLLPHHSRETSRPSVPRILRHDTFNRVFVN